MNLIKDVKITELSEILMKVKKSGLLAQTDGVKCGIIKGISILDKTTKDGVSYKMIEFSIIDHEQIKRIWECSIDFARRFFSVQLGISVANLQNAIICFNMHWDKPKKIGNVIILEQDEETGIIDLHQYLKITEIPIDELKKLGL